MVLSLQAILSHSYSLNSVNIVFKKTFSISMTTEDIKYLDQITSISSIEMEEGRSCPYCNQKFPSNNKLYTHWRTSDYCGNEAQLRGSRLSPINPRYPIALLVSYDGTLGGSQATDIIRTKLSIEDSGKLAITRATEHTYRGSPLLEQDESMAAAGDVIIFSTKYRAANKEDWIQAFNSQLPSSIKILDYEPLVVKNITKNLNNAEQFCTARIYELVVPVEILVPNYNITEDTDVEGKSIVFKELKDILQSLRSPKLGTGGGYRFRKSNAQLDIKLKQRWHNFCADESVHVVPSDAAVCRMIDRFTVSDFMYQDKKYFRFKVTGDGFLTQQVRRMVGTVVCIARKLLPEDFPSVALDPSIIVSTPCAPNFAHLKEVRFDWYHGTYDVLFTPSKELLRKESDRITHSFIDSQEFLLTWEAWVSDMETTVCPMIRQQLSVIRETNAASLVSAEASRANNRQETPEVYREVLRLLRDADRSGQWPATSEARSKVLRVESKETGGSFSVGRPVEGQLTPRGNKLFAELVDAVFRLERALLPDRPPSSMAAINRRASFLPHTDAGAGYGQTTSLIVGLGDYEGGYLSVEGTAHDICYKPLSFDGWRQRHWTLPFSGERFSLVWFTPLSQNDGSAPGERYQL